MFSKKEQQEIHHKLKILNDAKQCNNVTLTCRKYRLSRDTFYRWKRQYLKDGEKGLINSKPCVIHRHHFTL